MKRALAVLIAILIMAACRNEIPEPEALSAKAEDSIRIQMKDMTVRHHVRGQSVYIECVAPGISFSDKGPADRKGKIRVYIDGKLEGEQQTAAFILKGLEKGDRHVKLDIVTLDNQSYGISKEFFVNIQ